MLKKTLLAVVAALFMTGCANAFNRVDRTFFQNSAGDYHLVQYTLAGNVDYWVHNIKVTQEHETDGVFFFLADGTMVEIQGPVTSVRLKHGFDGPDRLPANLLAPAK
jgi:hypothetical protein